MPDRATPARLGSQVIRQAGW